MENRIEKNPEVPCGTRFIIDWFSMTTRIHTVDELVDLLGLRGCNFIECLGNHGFARRITFGGISIHYNRDETEGKGTGRFVWLEMSGSGCRTFETYGTGDFESLIALVNQEYGKSKTDKDVRLTRLDIAFDDMDGGLDIDRIFDDTRAGNFVSRFSKFSYTGGSDGLSVTFGSRNSNVLIRIYDKAAERGYSREEVPHWVRCELQIKDDNAAGFAWKLQSEPLSDLYRSTLKHYLSYRVPNPQDSNKRRWEETEYWSEFLSDAVAKSVLEKPGVVYNLMKCLDYLQKQPMGSIKTVIKIFGIDHFIRFVMEAPMPQNPKYDRLIAENLYDDYRPDKLLDILERQAADKEFLDELRAGYDEAHRIALDKARAYNKERDERERMRYLDKLYREGAIR